MRKLWKKIICITQVIAMMITGICINEADNCVSAAENDGGYLAVYVAKYEYNMGVEHAQFPSGNYTDNRRTDVLYYAISRDGVTYEGLNRDRAVYYPDGMIQLGSPSVFKKADGTYGLIASDNNNSNKVMFADSPDLLTFENERMKPLNNKGITVTNPEVVYDEGKEEYNIYWSSPDGNSYVTVTDDFESFSEPVETDYERSSVSGTLPVYANADEASVYKLTGDEYKSVMEKYGRLCSVSIKGAEDITAKKGDKITIPDKVDVVYSDGSTTTMGVNWDIAASGINTDNVQEGEYVINGKITGTTVYNTPVADFRADPYILYNEADGYYYMTGSYMQADLKNAYDYVVIRRAKTINELKDAEEVKIFSGAKKEEAGANVSPDYWAPEIHKIGGLYRILVQGTVDGTSHQVILTCNGDDLMAPENWSYTGYIGNTTDNEEIGPFDTTYFEYEGTGYYITQHTRGGSALDITTVDPSDPLTPTGPRVSIAKPSRAYENNIGTGQSILEGPAAIAHDGKLYVTYSGATIDMHYCTNLIYADLDSDLMNPDSWTKYQMPLFATSDITRTVKDSVLEDGNGEYVGQMGPGHSNFTVDENGNPLLVYHARDWSESYAKGNDKYGLSDPGRHAYVKCIHFGADGIPVLNMDSEDILSDELRNVTLKVHVSDGKAPETPSATDSPSQKASPSPSPSPAPASARDDNKDNTDTKQKVVKGKVYVVGTNRYLVTDTKKKCVSYAGAVNKKIKKVVIPKSIKLEGVSYKVTGIAKKALYSYSKLKNVIIKSTSISTIGKNALEKLKNKVIVKLPKAKYSAYKKLISKRAGTSRLVYR